MLRAFLQYYESAYHGTPDTHWAVRLGEDYDIVVLDGLVDKLLDLRHLCGVDFSRQ